MSAHGSQAADWGVSHDVAAAVTTARIKLLRPHKAQRLVRADAGRFNVVACGRRWGKTEMGVALGVETFLKWQPVGWFAPTYKLMIEAWDRFIDVLAPLGNAVHTSKTDWRIKLNGGSIDFWTLAARDAGRGRMYARSIVDEASLSPYMEDEWTKSIRPTLTDLIGDAWFLFSPKGHNYAHRLYVKGQDGAHGWKSWQMPTASNPFIDKAEIEAAREDLPADAFAQEYLAEFLADAANPFGIHAIRECVSDGLATGPVVAWGADLAKSTDWTVVIGLNAAGEACVFQRWQSDWRNTLARLVGMFTGSGHAVVDSTGVGDPIVEELQRKCRNVEGFKFTGHSKQPLMEGLAVAIQRGDISFPDGQIVNELEIFQYEYRADGGVRYNAPAGLHDDCVDALALAVRAWRNQPVQVRMSADNDNGMDWVDNDDRRRQMVDGDEIWS